MSRILGENSLKETVATYLRRFAASVIDWLNKYRNDNFLRTEINIIALQTGFSIVVLSIVTLTFFIVDDRITSDVVSKIQGQYISSADAFNIVEEIQTLRTQRFAVVIVTIIAATIVFGYITARITLIPTRNALSAQKQFIGNIAHELRTPLSVIKTNNEITLLESTVSPDIRDSIESNIEELDRISEIINNLLSVSALIRPEQMEFVAVDLSGLSESVVHKYAALANRNEVRVSVKKNTDMRVWGNMTALQQIVSNLLKNAITYTPRNGSVELTIWQTSKNTVELSVRDTGIGIARKDLYRIFEPFYRADPSRSRVHAGSGLGLTIVSELIKIHRGRISVQSAVGSGTKVTVTLPGVRKSATAQKRKPDNVNEIAVDFSQGS